MLSRRPPPPASDHLKPNVWLSREAEEKMNSSETSGVLNLYTLIDSVEKDIELLEQLGMFHMGLLNLRYCR